MSESPFEEALRLLQWCESCDLFYDTAFASGYYKNTQEDHVPVMHHVRDFLHHYGQGA